MKKYMGMIGIAGLMASTLVFGGCGGGNGGHSPSADLTISKSHVGNFSQGQIAALYTATVKNSGDLNSSGLITVKEEAPAGMTIHNLSGDGWACTVATASCTRSDSLAIGASFPPITVSVDVAADAPATLINKITVSGGSDANTANNSATDATTILKPDLTVSKSHSGNFSQGQLDARYSITVRNIGPGLHSVPVTVKEEAPAGLTVRDLSGTGWTCELPTTSCTRSDALAADASYPPITVSVDVAANAPITLTNKTTVSSGSDANTANNSATDATTINTSVDAVDVGGGNNDPGYDASVGCITFEVHPLASFTYNITKFAACDRIVFDAGTAVSTINPYGTDKIIDINGSLNGNSVTIHLTGVDAAADAAIFGNNSFRTVFGDNSLLPKP